ncbi:unnamed protein product [Sympodiomycopsis kandeliae]
MLIKSALTRHCGRSQLGSMNKMSDIVEPASKLLLLLDWDETLTRNDTLSEISPTEQELQARNYKGPSFQWFSEQYTKDYTHHIEQHKNEIKTITDQCQFLNSLQTVELKSNTRIEEYGLFKKWNVDNACNRARNVVQLRSGVEDCLKSFLNTHRNDVSTGVISVSWSSEFIKAGLNTTDSNAFNSSQESFPIDHLRSNHIDPQTGKMSKKGVDGIRTAIDKSREMSRILSQQTDPQLVVYAGDSNTDLPCLLYASVGIIVGNNASLNGTLERLGLQQYVVQGHQAFVEQLQSSPSSLTKAEALPGGQNISIVLQNKAASDGFFLVRVPDWVQGTKMLETLLQYQQNKR